MPSPQVNGEVPHSAFLDHVFNYPVVKDSVSQIKHNPIGQHGINLTSSAYQTFAKPFVPYLRGPYQYISPYVQKADNLGDKALTRVDKTFPVVKKPTSEIYGDTKLVLTFPFRKSVESKDHVIGGYADERKSIGGQGVFPLGKALASTCLVVTAETIGWLRALFVETKQQAREKMN